MNLSFPTAVVWEDYSSPRSNKRERADTTIVEDTFLRTRINFLHYDRFESLSKDHDGAVVVLNAASNAGYVARLQEDLIKLRWVVLMLVGDEDSLFPSSQIYGKHSNMRVWLQMPRPYANDSADRYLICGYPPQAKILQSLLQENKSRIINWFFSGQVQNIRRSDCVHKLRSIGCLTPGVLNTTTGFWKGMPHDDYYRTMAQSKIIPCPAGTCTPDTLRMGEALEAGCLPLVDGRGPKGEFSRYWSLVFREQPPFPIVDSWYDICVAAQLRDWESSAKKVAIWWENYKNKLSDNLIDDIKTLIENKA